MHTYTVRFWGPSKMATPGVFHAARVSTPQRARSPHEALALALQRHGLTEVDVDNAWVSKPR